MDEHDLDPDDDAERVRIRDNFIADTVLPGLPLGSTDSLAAVARRALCRSHEPLAGEPGEVRREASADLAPKISFFLSFFLCG